jgi:tetratricopeptide (TPR) repeat protein
MNDKLKEAIRLREKGKGEASRKILLELADEHPKDAEILYQCAWTHDGLGLEKEAVEFYERAIANGLEGDDLAGAYLGLGSTLRGLGQYPKAVETLENGAQKFPKHKALKTFLAMAQYNNGQAKESVSNLLTLLAETNDPSIAEFKRAILFYAEDLDRVSET